MCANSVRQCAQSLGYFSNPYEVTDVIDINFSIVFVSLKSLATNQITARALRFTV